ncbi:MAG: hypothetical protein QXX24_00030 [Candidatus Bathyarchaeia archaeon]
MRIRRKIFGLHPPLTIFIILVVAFPLAGYLIIHSTLSRNLSEDGEHILFETDFLRLKFPRNWYVRPKWENESLYIINLFNTELDSFFGLVHYKSLGFAQSVFQGLDLRNGLLMATFAVNSFYDRIRKEAQNATLQFLENGTLKVSGYDATYIIFRMENVTVRGSQYNVIGIVVYFLADQGLVEIIFYTWMEGVWEERYEVFRSEMLESLVIKHGT